MDWARLNRLGYDPPLIPPRGEVNAADAFDIGNFDDDEVKGFCKGGIELELNAVFRHQNI